MELLVVDDELGRELGPGSLLDRPPCPSGIDRGLASASGTS
jgi:hypothetical protein